MKNKKILIIIIVVIILALSVTLGILFNVKNTVNTDSALFIHSFKGYAKKPISVGYIIYNDGVIKEYNEFGHKKLKKNKLTESELEELKTLADEVQDEYIDDGYTKYDAGTTVNKIFNSKQNAWIILNKDGESNGSNDSEESKKIMDFVNNLYDKYINQD